MAFPPQQLGSSVAGSAVIFLPASGLCAPSLSFPLIFLSSCVFPSPAVLIFFFDTVSFEFFLKIVLAESY